MKLSLKSCGKTLESSGAFRVVVAIESDDGSNTKATVEATLTERTTGPAFGQYGPIVEELVAELLSQINAALAPPPVVAPEPVVEAKVSTLPKKLSNPPKGAA